MASDARTSKPHHSASVRRTAVVLVLIVALIVGAISAWPSLSRRMALKADETIRFLALRDLVTELQAAADATTASRRLAEDDLRRIVENPSSRATLSTNDVPRYELVWDGRPISKEALGQVVLVRESALAYDGRRGIAYADGRVEFVDR